MKECTGAKTSIKSGKKMSAEHTFYKQIRASYQAFRAKNESSSKQLGHPYKIVSL